MRRVFSQGIVYDMGSTDTPAFGWCGTIEQAASFQAAGLDYAELQLVPMNLEDASALREAKRRLRDVALPVRAFSYLFPRDVRVVGPSADVQRNRRYFDRVVEVMAESRPDIVVFGSGWTRDCPPGWTLLQTEDAFLETLAWCADALAGSGTTLVIEPLNRKESNFINSVADGARVARRLNRPEVRSLADFYHMDEEGEPLDALVGVADCLAHVHVADSGRFNPGTGRYDYPTFFANLVAIGYRGLISAECAISGEPVAAMRDSVSFLRETWRAATRRAAAAAPLNPGAGR